MRKFILFTCVLVVMNMHADVIPPPEDTKVRVQITNLSDFPDLAIVGLHECSNNGKKIPTLVKDELSIQMINIYTNCPKIFYVIKKEYLEKVGIDKIDWSTDKHVQQLNVIADWNGLQTEFYSTLEVDFKLAKREGTYYVYKTRLLLRNRNYGNKQTLSTTEFVRIFTDDVVNVHEPIRISTINVPYSKYL